MVRRMVWMSVVLLAAAGAWAAEPSPELKAALDNLVKQVHENAVAAPALRAFAEERLIPLSANPVLVNETRKQNGRKVPLEKIQASDKEWIAGGATLSPFKQSLLDNAASRELRRVAEDLKAVREAFTMDNQGAVVGETNLTSDYWQGDEKKWTESYLDGKGGAFIAPAEFDASADTVLQQISLPLLDASGKVIGAVTWGVVLEKIDWRAPAKKP